MKLLLIDDHKMIGESLKESLRKNKFVESIDVFVDPTKAIKNISEKEYDIVLMDINMGKASEKSGLEIAKSLIQRDPEIKIVMLTGFDLLGYEREAKRIGARGFISKDEDVDALVYKLERVMEGELFFKNTINYSEDLTEREEQIVKLYCEGKTRKEMSEILDISMRTVANSISIIYEKLYVTNYQELILKAIEMGLIQLKTYREQC